MAQAFIGNNKASEILKTFTYGEYTVHINTSSLNLCSYTYCKLCDCRLNMLYCSGHIIYKDTKILIDPGYFKVDKCFCDNNEAIKIIFTIDNAMTDCPEIKDFPFYIDNTIKQFLLSYLKVKIVRKPIAKLGQIN